MALDEAFCFYYADNLKLLEEMGAKLVPFSPLHDKSLPPDLDGLYLGGGYPELYARSLAENETMRQSVRQAVTNEMPTIAECGGFLYLQQSLADRTGNDFPMAGALPGKGQMTDRLVRFWLCGSFIAPGANDLSSGRTNQGPFLSLFGYDEERRKFFGPKTKRRVFLRSGRAAVVRGISPFVFLEQSGRSIPFFGAVRHISKGAKSMNLQKTIRSIQPLDKTAMEQAARRWDSIAKPLHSLGLLEETIIRAAGMQRTSRVSFSPRALLVFCADNGVVAQGVTQTDQSVTAIVTENFTKGKTSSCVMAEKAGVDLIPVDIGVSKPMEVPGLLQEKIRLGTDDFTLGPAMRREEAVRAVETGIRLARQLANEGYRAIATGEMGIGNTTTSAAVVSVLLGYDPAEVTGVGAGLSSEGLGPEGRDHPARYCGKPAKPGRRAGCTVQGWRIGFSRDCRCIFGSASAGIPVVIDGLISRGGGADCRPAVSGLRRVPVGLSRIG